MKVKIKQINWQQSYVSVVRKKRQLGQRPVENAAGKEPEGKSCGCVIMDAVFKLLATGKYFSVCKIARALDCSRPEISNAVMLATGMPLMDLIDEYRLKRAIEMLCYTDIPGTEIGKLCGFANYNSFSKFFVRKMRFTPFAYRRCHQPKDFGFIYEW